MSSSALPPPSNLPSWSRISTLDRSRYPRPFVRDRVPLPPSVSNGESVMDFNANLSNVDVRFLEKMTSTTQHQKMNYDKSIKFLQQQQADMLYKLQRELDDLKRENKDLKFKLVLVHGSGSQNVVDGAQKHPQNPKADPNTIFLKQEIENLRKALKDSKSSNNNKIKEKKIAQSHNNVSPPNQRQSSSRLNQSHRRTYSISNLSTSLPLNATLNPLQVKDTTNDVSRSPTMLECESIISELQEINSQQLAELSRLRSDRRVPTPSSSSPEPIVTKTFGFSMKESFSDTRLPRIPVKPPTKRSVKSASLSDMKVILPDLKNAMTINIADRHRRLNAIQNKKFNNLK